MHEGSVTIYKAPRDNAILSDSDPEFLDVIHDVTDIDIGDLQYFKIFSLYSMRYDINNNSFFYPDSQIKSFGDTAIIIHDMESFLRKYLQQILKVHGELVTVFMDEVHYFDYQETIKLMPSFSKPKSYAYQNELRLAIGLMESNIYSLDFTNSVIRSTEPFTLNIGDIRDIACVLPIDDFLQLRLPKDLEWKFPTRSVPGRIVTFPTNTGL